MKTKEEILIEVMKQQYPLASEKECVDEVMHNRFRLTAVEAMGVYAAQESVRFAEWKDTNFRIHKELYYPLGINASYSIHGKTIAQLYQIFKEDIKNEN